MLHRRRAGKAPLRRIKESISPSGGHRAGVKGPDEGSAVAGTIVNEASRALARPLESQPTSRRAESWISFSFSRADPNQQIDDMVTPLEHSVMLQEHEITAFLYSL